MKAFQLKAHFFSLVLFLLFFISVFYIYYLLNYPSPPFDTSYLLKYYPKDIMLKTGGRLRTPDRRFQHFLNFTQLKEEAIVRIGTFGDSFTFGEEVDKVGTYPFRLQQLFNEQFPNKRIEVLNFGMSGTGVQEQFFLWEKYSKIYNLDYVLFGPRGFYSDRNVTFGMSWGAEHFAYFAYPKERFILLDDNRLKLVWIKGNTLKERYKNYYKLIPLWTTLRYDKNPFKIWGKFLPFLRSGVQNPFYYRKISEEEESVKLNTILLQKIKKQHNKKMLFFTDHSHTFSIYESIKSKGYNFNFVEIARNRFYEVFGHKSSLGNELIANVYFNALIGKSTFSFQSIDCYFKLLHSVDRSSDFDEEHLHAVKSIQVLGEQVPVLTLRHNFSDHYLDEGNRGSYSNNKDKGTKSFIGFFNKTNFLKSPFIPLSFRLKEGMKIYIKSGYDKIELGAIRPLDTFGRFFMFYGDFVKGEEDRRYIYYRVYFLLKNLSTGFLKKIENINNPLELFLEDYKLGVLRRYDFHGQKSLQFDPVNGYKQSFLMMGPSHSVKEKDLPLEFSVYIQYNMENGKIFKSLIPDWRCKKKEKQIHLKLPNFEPLNLKRL